MTITAKMIAKATPTIISLVSRTGTLSYFAAVNFHTRGWDLVALIPADRDNPIRYRSFDRAITSAERELKRRQAGAAQGIGRVTKVVVTTTAQGIGRVTKVVVA